MQWWRLDDLDGEIETLQKGLNELNDKLARGKPTLKAFEKVDEWDKGDVRWLDRLAQFNDNMPATSKIHVTRLDLSPKVGNATPATIKGDARAHDVIDVANLTRDLVKVPSYGLSAYRKLGHDPKDDADYPYEFDFEILLNDPSKKPAAKGPALPAAKPAETPAPAAEKAAAAEKDAKR